MLQELGCCRAQVGPPPPLPSPQGEASSPGLSSAALPCVSSMSPVCPAASRRGQYPSRARLSRALPTSLSRQQPRGRGPRGRGPAGTPQPQRPPPWVPLHPAPPSHPRGHGEAARPSHRPQAVLRAGAWPRCPLPPSPAGAGDVVPAPPAGLQLLDFGLSTGVAVAAVRLPVLAEPHIASAVRPAPRPHRGTAGNVGDVPVLWGGCGRGCLRGWGPLPRPQVWRLLCGKSPSYSRFKAGKLRHGVLPGLRAATQPARPCPGGERLGNPIFPPHQQGSDAASDFAKPHSCSFRLCHSHLHVPEASPEPSSAQLGTGGGSQSQGGSGRAMAPVGYWPQGEPG